MKTVQHLEKNILQSAEELLIDLGILSRVEAGKLLAGDCCSSIDSDGSSRRFLRFSPGGSESYLIAAPAGSEAVELAESRATWKIGRHLYKKGIPVPKLYAWDKSSGVLIFEDLGDTRLHDVIVGDRVSSPPKPESLVHYYNSALEHLAAMQILGADSFDASWCWDSPQYDVQLMIEKESGYFLRAFWQGLLGDDINENVWPELKEIASLAGKASVNYFLHRDFQSRNIMLKGNEVRFIDFQGGRFGPLAYDVASLLIDPYTNLSLVFQDELLESYLGFASKYLEVSILDFKKQFKLLAFQRNMQIIGAFSFLYNQRNKKFFKQYIQPSLISLGHRLSDPLFKDYPILQGMITRCLKEHVPA